jgi:hypothetical protein
MTTTVNWQKSSFSGGGEGNDCLELATTGPTPLAHLLQGIRSGALSPAVPEAVR